MEAVNASVSVSAPNNAVTSGRWVPLRIIEIRSVVEAARHWVTLQESMVPGFGGLHA
jgi:hypothetical protein